MHLPTHTRCSGFSLMEMLLVVAIVAILMALLTPAVKVGMTAAKATKCASNWRQWDVGVKLFVAANEGRLPVSAYSTSMTSQVWYQIGPYVYPGNQMTSSDLRTAMFKKLSCYGSDWDFGFNVYVSGKPLAALSAPARTIYGIDLHGPGSNTAQWLDMNAISGSNPSLLATGVPKPHSGKVNVLFVDGHVETRFVSTLSCADITRDSTSYTTAQESKAIGDPAYDK